MRLFAALTLAWTALQEPQEASRKADKPASQPTSRPAASQAASRPTSQPSSRPAPRRPEQVRLFQDLLQKANEPGVIQPQGPAEPKSESAVTILPEGTTIAERAGKLVRTGDHWEFQFYRDDVQPGLQGIEVLKSAFLDQMERLAQNGATEFVVSGEMTSYRGQNYLLIRKVRRQLDHGNLSP